ncbi:hypothetical protein BH11PAT1_BH11PAT1_6060 [soil metagenome]
MQQPATKKDLHELRGEMKKMEKSLRGEILGVEEKVEGLDEKVERLDKKVGGLGEKVERLDEKVEKIQKGQETIASALTQLQNTLDGFVGTVDELRTNTEVGAHQIRELDVRVTKIESSLHAEK